nr:uncharacterized protein I203_00026 [Kwoniella mangroviensis CBS 8507]OCF69899.1 hypothetical protein I203_00026 [Kwoniella mangroviensis CBS 8507]
MQAKQRTVLYCPGWVGLVIFLYSYELDKLSTNESSSLFGSVRSFPPKKASNESVEWVYRATSPHVTGSGSDLTGHSEFARLYCPQDDNFGAFFSNELTTVDTVSVLQALLDDVPIHALFLF